MAFYKECPNCGCALDPGEKCDCEQEKERQIKIRASLFSEGARGQLKFNFPKEEHTNAKIAI